jgi:hypothetical protein
MKRTLATLCATAFLVLAAAPPGQAQSRNEAFERIVRMERESLDDRERASMRYMLQVHKMARDVYLQYFDLWKVGLFSELAHGKQLNMDAMLELMRKYDLAPQVRPEEFGQFSDRKFSKQYSNFLQTGRLSMFEALRAAGTIENLCLFDASNQMERTDNQDLRRAYALFMQESRDNLQRIKKLLNLYGEKIGQDIWMF